MTSPEIDLSDFIEPYLVFYTWFYNGGTDPNDQMLISLIDTAGNEMIIDTLDDRGVAAQWILHNIKVIDYMDPAELAHIRFSVSDRGAQHIVEAGVDHFFLSEGKYIGLEEINARDEVSIYPNPFNDQLNIRSQSLIRRIRVYDASSRLIIAEDVLSDQYTLDLGGIENGVYILQLEDMNGEVESKKVLKY